MRAIGRCMHTYIIRSLRDCAAEANLTRHGKLNSEFDRVRPRKTVRRSGARSNRGWLGGGRWTLSADARQLYGDLGERAREGTRRRR